MKANITRGNSVTENLDIDKFNFEQRKRIAEDAAETYRSVGGPGFLFSDPDYNAIHAGFNPNPEGNFIRL